MCSGTPAARIPGHQSASWKRGLVAVALVVLGSSAAAQRPYPVYTEYHLDRTMVLVGRNFAGGTEALADGDYEVAKQRFSRTREQIAPSISFWRHQELDDAIRMLRRVIEKLDELDAALSAQQLDAAAALADQIRDGCDACHAVYREEDPDIGSYGVNKQKL